MNARTAAKRPEIPVTAPNVMAGAKSKWTMRQYLVPTRSLDNSTRPNENLTLRTSNVSHPCESQRLGTTLYLSCSKC
jgi:hypothetical protein